MPKELVGLDVSGLITSRIFMATNWESPEAALDAEDTPTKSDACECLAPKMVSGYNMAVRRR